MEKLSSSKGIILKTLMQNLNNSKSFDTQANWHLINNEGDGEVKKSQGNSSKIIYVKFIQENKAFDSQQSI